MIDEKVLVERLEETRWTTIFDTTCIFENDKLDKCIKIVNQLAEESNNGWIPCSERLPSKEECGDYGTEFLTTIPQGDGYVTIALKYKYETVRGKEVSRWTRNGRIYTWKVVAWQPLPAPYKPGEK